MFRAWLLALTMLAPAAPAATDDPAAVPVPPVAARHPHVVKSPHGERVDDYHWLRDDDPKAKRPEILAHLRAENDYTAKMLAPLAPLQAELVAEMRSRIKEDDDSLPVYDQGWWVWREYAAGAEYPVHKRRRGSPERPDPKARVELLLDEPARAAGHAYWNVGSMAVSPDGRYLAWTEDTAGRRMHTLRIRDLQRGEDLPDAIPGVLESLAWAADGRTLFYIRQDPVTLQSGPVWRHRVGTPAGDDVLVYDEPDQTLFTDVHLSASRRYVVIAVSGFDTAETLAVPAARPTEPPRVVLARREKVRHSADHLRGRWILRTNEGAPNFRLVQAPESAPDDRRRWKTLVPGREQATLEGFALFERGIAIEERVEADRRVRLFSGGRWQTVAGAPASTASLGEHRDPRAAHLRFTVTSLVQPTETWDHHLASGTRTLRKRQPVPNYDAALYRSERFWAPARDGARVPVTLAWRPDRARLDGTAPLLLIGYGAYGSSYDPTFSSNRPSLMDRGFVVAIAHVRGGAELGEGWYEAGRLMHKWNTFNDFVDVAEALVRQQRAAPDKVFASGGSAGGLLMGVVANVAPQRFAGIAADVPFVDALTTMLDETIPLTVNEWTQWGDPREKAAHDYILSYSPYDNIRAQDYPPMLVTTGLWDSQVQYFEPVKYVAKLRATKTDRHPLLLHVNMDAGHGGASGRFEVLAEIAREYAFFIDLAQRHARR
ncbi:MAG: S9 family peptidase [Rubrivivax sp.]|nr:S9 family peptidase [Rubrivivax sp.]